VLVIKFIINFSQEDTAIGQPKSSKNYEVTVSESETVCEDKIDREKERERDDFLFIKILSLKFSF